ncbi:MAG: Uma2 family endonuclease, partial [Bacteroidia bacterium]|nr:Uma2 family endonuclease [Bacteroidia bacterium]
MKTLTPQEYLARERSRRREEGMYEYIQGNLIEMGGVSLIHNRIVGNLHVFIAARLRELGFEVWQSDLRVTNPALDTYMYPDIVITQDEPVFADSGLDMITNPLLIVEVLSDTTEAYDRGEKFERYRSIPSLQEYVLVSQKKPLIESYYRT